jgi:ABC-type amino acid transport system permease subunit/prefoldin subunit 5
MQGDAVDLTNARGLRLANGVADAYAGDASVKNPRLELGNALAESAKLTSKIPGMTEDAQTMSGITKSALQNYSGAVDAVQKTLTNLNTAGAAIQAATSGLASIDTTRLEGQLNNSSQAMGNVINTLEVIKLLQGSIGGTIDNLRSAQNNLQSLRGSIHAIGNVAADARNAQATIDRIVSSGQQTLATLKAFDVNGALFVLSNVDNRLAEVRTINIPLITAQLQYMSAAIPQLKDDEINQSIKLLDKFIAGQVIPSARIQILMNNSIPAESVSPAVEKLVGHKNFAVYSGALGVIEPNPRGEILQVLLEVKAILAGMTAIAVTAIFLALDHTGVMAYIRRKRLLRTIKPTGWRRITAKLVSPFAAAEKRYGMFTGAVLLTTIFLLSGGGIPYLPWIGVPFIGALIGLAAAHYAEKISPVSSEEVMAGEALGMSMDEVMREIVIPNGRPGLLQKLNQRKLKIR